MIRRILSVLVVIALLAAPLTARPSKVSAASVSTASISPATPNTTTQLSVTFTLNNVVNPGGYVLLTLSSVFQVPTSSISSPVVTISPAVAGLTAQLGNSGLIYLFSSSAAFVQLTSYTVTITTAANIKTPTAPGSYSVTVGSSVYAEGTASYPLVVGGSGVSGVGAFLSSLTVGQSSSYTVVFNTSVAGALNGPVDTITVTFPAGTTIPAAYTPGSVTVNANAAITVVKLSTTQVQVTMPTVSPVTSVVLVFQTSYGLVNTTIAGTYSVYVATSLDLMPVASNSFALAGSSLSNLSVTVTPLTPSSVAQFSISFLTSSPAAGLKSGDTIKVEFPVGTQFPSGSFCPVCFVINGQQAQSAPTRSNNVVTITVPTTLPIAQQFVSLQISATANITNPSSAGSYSLKVYTSLDTTPVSSSQYTLVGSSIGNLAVAATPTSQSAYPELRFTFMTSSSGGLTTGDYIYVQLPTAMTVPSTIPAASVTVNGVQASSVSRDGSEKLSIRTPIAIGNSQQVTLVIAATSGIRNPSTVGTTVSFDVSTSEDVGTRSASYTTTISQITQPQVTLTTNGVGKTSGYTVVFQTGAGGLLPAGTGRIYIVFPSGTSVPASIASQNVRVNGGVAAGVLTSPGNRRVEITTAAAVAASSQVTVVLDVAANVVNPSSASTSYTLTAYTSAEQTLVSSAPYAVVNLPTSTAVTYPANPDGPNGYYRTRPSVTITASSPSGLPVSIYYRVNAGSDTLYASPVQIPDGAVTLTYYARDSQSNQEQPKQLVFKVDATAPVVTVLSPQEGTVTSMGVVSITGRTEAGSSVTINGSSVPVQTNGDFGGGVTLTEGANAIQIIATDVAGNIGQARVNVTLDTKQPVLTVTSPKIYATVMTQQVAVTGKTEAGATVTVAGAQVAVASDGSFSIMYMFPKEGLNVVDITATDAAGNVARTGIPVTYVARTLIRLQVGNKTAMINDTSKTLQAAPINVKGTVMVPIRFIGEAFGATVEWEPTFKIVRLQLGSTTIYLQIGSNYASVNGKKIVLQGLPSIIKGTTMVPIRFISEAFNAEVVWNAPTQGIDITYPKP